MSDAKKENVYLSIDLKSFYASVECRERGLDPMKTNLVVADKKGESAAVSDAKKENVYLSIDLKSFYASVECRERGLDPMKTNLVVADAGRTEKTICLAVSPSLKAYILCICGMQGKRA